MTFENEQGDADMTFLLRSLSRVGPEKPIGYLPLNTLKKLVKSEPEDVAADAAARGLATLQFGPEKCCIKSGALYVYHREALERLLKTRAYELTASEIPTNPERFVAHIAAVWLEPSHQAYPIIAEAFGKAP